MFSCSEVHVGPTRATPPPAETPLSPWRPGVSQRSWDTGHMLSTPTRCALFRGRRRLVSRLLLDADARSDRVSIWSIIHAQATPAARLQDQDIMKLGFVPLLLSLSCGVSLAAVTGKKTGCVCGFWSFQKRHETIYFTQLRVVQKYQAVKVGYNN